MKRYLIALLCFLTPVAKLYCQLSPNDVNPPPANKPFNFDQNIGITTFDGRPFPGDMAGVDGSPYFFDEFVRAKLILSNGQVYDSISLKLNMASNDIIALSAKDPKYLVLKKGLVREFVFNDAAKPSINKVKFRCNYPTVDNNDENTYYQVLTDGKLQVLKYDRRIYKETKDLVSGEIKKEFTGNEFLYLYNDKEMLRLKKNKEAILSLMDDKGKEIDKWLDGNKINFKNLADIQKLISLYNSLQ